ncbi:MAG: agmatinase [Deltaproteobacteria bacterium]|nr:agmatinase [Deltaproteobacteria bacterium]
MMQTLPFNFGGLSPELASWESAKVAVLPVPYDGTSNIQPGSRHGPSAIIQHSRHIELFDEELLVDVASSVGICTMEELEPDMRGSQFMVARCHEAAQAVVQADRFLLTLGGEGTVALGPIKAVAERYPQMTVLHLDAHLDLRPEYQGTAFHHMCVARQVHESMGLHLTQVGTRSFCEEEFRYVEEKGLRPFLARDIAGRFDWLDRLLETLHDEVYVSVDVSVFDPSSVPATARPVPGGLDWYLVAHMLRRVGEKRRIVGADIHELTPIPGQPASEILATRLAYKLIGYALLLR